MRGYVHGALKLQHHRHTGRKLHHHHTSYRGLFVLMAIVALSMSLIQRAGAADFTVTAEIPSNILSQPARITSPVAGDTITSANVTVQGTCQVVISGTVVELVRDGIVIGTTACQSTSRFSVTITLTPGENIITPKVYDGLGTPGPDGDPLTLTWTPPVSPPPSTPEPQETPGQQPPTQQKVLPLGLTSEGNRGTLSYETGKLATLRLVIGDGTVPYRVLIDWGDGTDMDFSTVDRAGPVEYSHVYMISGFHEVTITVTDDAGQTAVLQVLAVSLVAPLAQIVPPQAAQGGAGSIFSAPLAQGVWTAYGAVSLTVISLWLFSPTHTLLAQLPWAVHRVFPRRWPW